MLDNTLVQIINELFRVVQENQELRRQLEAAQKPRSLDNMSMADLGDMTLGDLG